MADISSFLKKILSAIYGDEVRGSIHDALAAMNTEPSSAMEFASTAKDSAQANAAAAKKSAEDAEKKATSASESAAWWIWDAETGAYYDSHISCELQGPIGVGIQDIRLTKGDHSPGTTDIYTVHMTDGSTYTISVYNGLNGTGAGDVLGISLRPGHPRRGVVGGASPLRTSGFWPWAPYKYFLSADEACKEEFLDCNVKPKNITTSGFLTLTCDTEPAADLTVNLIRLELSGNGAIQ